MLKIILRLGNFRLSIQLNKLTGLVLLCLAFFSSGLVAQENKFSLSSYGDEFSTEPDKFFYYNELEGVLFLNGEIKKGMYTNFRQAIAENKIHTIVLNSFGGNVDEGLDIATTVFDKGIKTYVPKENECYSACSFIFFAGSERYTLGKLGVHQVGYADDVAKEKFEVGVVTSISQLTTADILLRLGEFKTPRFVEQRMLRTKKMYIFNTKELNKLGNLDVSTTSKVLFKKIDKFIEDLNQYNAEQSCNIDATKCSPVQLCSRAAANKSWITTTEAENYVKAAKGKGLSCGVPAPVCPEDIKKCTTEYLCTYATMNVDTGLSWLNNSFADEAKLRGLSCNVKETKTSVKRSNTPQVVNGSLSGTWDVLYSLCTDQRYEAVLKLSQDTKINKNEYYATYDAPHGNYTGIAKDNNGNFVINLDRGLIANGFIYQNYNRAQGKDQNGCLFEAKKRLKKSYVKTDKVNSCVLDIRKCTTKQLCARGTRIVNSNFLWQTNINFEKYVTEAKRRGLSCGVKIKPQIKKTKTINSIDKTKSCVQEVRNCNSKQLCTRATKMINSNVHWDNSKHLKKYVTEAKRRGFSCGVNDIVKSIQKQLNRLDCSAGFADGILGKKTLSALERWKNAGGNYTPNKIDQKLRSDLFESKYKCSAFDPSYSPSSNWKSISGKWDVTFKKCKNRTSDGSLSLKKGISSKSFKASYSAKRNKTIYDGELKLEGLRFEINVKGPAPWNYIRGGGVINRALDRILGKDQNGCIFEARR